jgi:hypothetical protein
LPLIGPAAGRAQVEDLLSDVVLPASVLVPANCVLAYELWGVLQLLPYTARFRLYVRLRVRLASLKEGSLGAAVK